jgi:hypothetical protein
MACRKRPPNKWPTRSQCTDRKDLQYNRLRTTENSSIAAPGTARDRNRAIPLP